MLAIVTTIYPLEYFASRIAGDLADVVNLVSPGVEAHDFSPSPNDIKKLDAADLIFYNGRGLEPWIDRALENIPGNGRVVIEATAILRDRSESNTSRVDPHIWLDPTKAKQQVTLLRDGMIEVNPENGDIYNANAELLQLELDELDRQFEMRLADCRLAEFATSHDAFGHLAGRYGLVQIPISGLSPEAEPSPRDLADITDQVRELDIKFLMIEPLISSRLTETIAKEVGAELLPLHPLETLTSDEGKAGATYFSVMKANLESLATALECGSSSRSSLPVREHTIFETLHAMTLPN